jgi:hypothetical protein
VFDKEFVIFKSIYVFDKWEIGLNLEITGNFGDFVLEFLICLDNSAIFVI